MNIDHVHFYVENAGLLRDWFVHTLGFCPHSTGSDGQTHTEVVSSGKIFFVLSSPLSSSSPVAQYLQFHPPGVADLAFQVTDLESKLASALQAGAKLLQPLVSEVRAWGRAQKCQIQGWGNLRHTLLERVETTWASQGRRFQAGLNSRGRETVFAPLLPLQPLLRNQKGSTHSFFVGIDHVVLNVAAGDLDQAITWYEETLGFQRQQSFMIQTERSGLCSQVLNHPEGSVQLPINQPASPTSQIQEFLDVNRGPGVQHIALQTQGIVEAIAQVRQRGLAFLRVPPTYYSQLRQRPGFQFSDAEWKAIAQQGILVDWREERPEAPLLQAFTEPIFEQPTFFFEMIERQTYWANQECRQAEGFGEGNFRALFEAIEREQIKRGSLA